jgi:hypothetical protein
MSTATNKAIEKSTVSVDNFVVVLDRHGAMVCSHGGVILGQCNRNGFYMSLATPQNEALVTRIARKALGLSAE